MMQAIEMSICGLSWLVHNNMCEHILNESSTSNGWKLMGGSFQTRISNPFKFLLLPSVPRITFIHFWWVIVNCFIFRFWWENLNYFDAPVINIYFNIDAAQHNWMYKIEYQIQTVISITFAFQLYKQTSNE